jgi:hypothetical protein
MLNTKMTPAQKVLMQDFMNKYFAFLEKNWNPLADDLYWDSLTEEAMALIDQFYTSDNVINDFIQNLIVNFINSREAML